MHENNLIRYSLITTKMKREMILLIGTGCKWKKCKFCDYYNDVSSDPFLINKSVINKLTGKFGVLDVVNSGSCFELDKNTLNFLKEKVSELTIHTIWFEAHWLYHNELNEFRSMFPGIVIKFRSGIETFNASLRNSWSKGIPCTVSVNEIAKYFDGVCLLVGIKGQTKDIILEDIKLALKHFEYFNINVFNKNSTSVERDENLISWFKTNIAPQLKENNHVEILINNKDLGVG
ncbi:MAG: hypothetical protein RUMPE_00263 [Eubacteriales bacterium SKADARSKE-1]|nr:hypothetical protein [Eubacteriales bacterium SKADARSKE-1]